MTTVPRLAKITAATFEAAIALEVGPDQEHLVAPVVKSLAEAYVHPGIRAVATQHRGRRAGPRLRPSRLTTTWHPGESGPEGFHLTLGFVLTGELSGDQRVGELELS